MRVVTRRVRRLYVASSTLWRIDVPGSAPPARGAELGQCCAQQAVEASVLERRLAQQLLERGARGRTRTLRGKK